MKIIGIIFLLLSTSSWQTGILYAEADEDLISGKLKKIGVEEFQIQSRSNNFNKRQLSPGTGIKVADIFYKELESYHHYDLTAPSEMPVKIELVKAPVAKPDVPLKQTNESQTVITEEKRKSLMGNIGANLIDLDSIVARTVSRYNNTDLDAVVSGVITSGHNDKDGSAIAVNKPASVAFVAYLISLRDKKIIWSGHFAETQVALFDNLFLADRFLQAGGTWLSSDDLTQIVMRKVIKNFPGVKQTNVKLISE